MHLPDTVPHESDFHNFSLIRGGPFHDFQSRFKLAAKGPHAVEWEVLIVIVITWLPLLILSGVEGEALGRNIHIPLLQDYATNIRFLLSLPLLIAARSIIDPHIKEAIHHFVAAGLVTDKQLPAYERLLGGIKRLRDSWIPTVILLLIAFGPSFSSTGEIVGVSDTSSWHYVTSTAGPRIGWAGLWFSFISVPLYRLVMFRWIWLLIVWAIFLWRVTHLRLNCVASHPDRAGGLGFLTHTEMFFGMVTFAMSSTLAGAFANMMTYEGSSLSELKFLMIGACLLAVAITAAPLIVVMPGLFRVKQRGIFEYSSLGVEYAEGFDHKWIRGQRSTKEELLGAADIQSLADLGNSYEIIHDMKIVLIDHEILLQLAIPALIPMLVLAATATPAEKILEALLHLI